MLPAFLLFHLLQRKRHNIAKAIVQGYAHLVQVAAKESAKDVKVVVRTVVKQHVAVDVEKIVKVDVMLHAKAIVSPAVRSHVTAYVATHA